MYQLAHRGLSQFYPENTMLAFKEALEGPFDGLETDVQMTKDGELILLHDATIDRTSDGTGYVCDYTYEELLKFNFNNGFEGVHTPIPRLEELLELMTHYDKILNIEIKAEAKPGTEEKVVELVKKYNLKKVYYSSTDVNQMLRIRELVPDAYVALIIVSHYQHGVEVASMAKLDGIHSRYNFLNKDNVEDLKTQGFKMGAWTVPNRKTFVDMEKKGMLFAFTNKFIL